MTCRIEEADIVRVYGVETRVYCASQMKGVGGTHGDGGRQACIDLGQADDDRR